MARLSQRATAMLETSPKDLLLFVVSHLSAGWLLSTHELSAPGWEATEARSQNRLVLNHTGGTGLRDLGNVQRKLRECIWPSGESLGNGPAVR